MPQVLKEEVRARIDEAALDAFAAEGYHGATMAEIARRAGISAGNIYRYYPDKSALFDAVLPASFVARFRTLLRRRVDAAERGIDLPTVPEDHPYARASREVLDFSIEHRRRVMLLLGHAGGTRYEDVAGQVVEELMGAAVRHFGGGAPVGGERPGLDDTRAFGLEQIYRNYVASLVGILERFADPDAIRRAVAAYERYHLVGLAGFFE